MPRPRRQSVDTSPEVRPAAMSISAMAREVGLSRSRFYALIGTGTFPRPVYLLRTRRPVYTPELQRACLEARRSGLGAVNGQPVVFYQKSPKPKAGRRKGRASETVPPRVARLIAGLKQLGMSDPKPSAVSSALAEAYPDGTGEAEPGAVLAAVYRRLRASE